MPRTVAGALLLLMLAGCATPPASLPEPAAPEPDLSEREVQARIDFIEERLEDRQLHAQIWYWGWLTIFTGSTIGNSYAAATTDHGPQRANGIAQAVLSASGIGDALFRPFNARFGAEPIRVLPDATPEDRRQKLARAEALLRGNAERASERTSWQYHLANAAPNWVAGLIVWAAGDGQKGAMTALTGTLGSEAHIWTEPGGPVQDWADYQLFRAGHLQEVAGGWQIVPALGGVTVRYRF